MVIRPAWPADADALSALANAAYVRYVERIGDSPAPMVADYASLIDAGEVWVADNGGRAVGLLVLRARPDHLLLDNVAVAPGEQGRGVGTQLLRLADEQARDRGLPEVRLYTNEAMTENLGYYRRHGFTETHRGIGDGYRRVYFVRSV